VKEPEVVKLKNCRTCGEETLRTFLSLGPMPIPNGFLKKEQLSKGEEYYPLDVAFCESCGLMTLVHVVRPDIMFRNYVYIPGTSQTMIKHFYQMAKENIKRFKMNKNSLAIDIGSNDGTLLKQFKSFGTKILGIDPAKNIAEEATKNDIETIADFFSVNLAKKISRSKGQADLITATNVIAHINNLLDLMDGVETLLKDRGVFLGEFPYLVDLIEHGEFDTIYHEHLSYFSIRSLLALAERVGLEIFDAKRTDVHGGSIQVFFRKKGSSKNPPLSSVEELVALERSKGLDIIGPFEDFATKTHKKREELTKLLKQLKARQKRIVGYGAAAKGNVLTNFFRIGPDLLDYIVDSIPYKQGSFTPGMHIPIYAESKLLEDQPDYALILAWNFADEITNKNKEYTKRGGKFITTVPLVKIV
jgi:SAM-dependent methyltransferase